MYRRDLCGGVPWPWKSEHPASWAEASGGGCLAWTVQSGLPEATRAQAVWEGWDDDSSWQVNHSPSFTTDSRLDREVKDALLCDAMTLVNLRGCDKRKVIEEDKRRVKERLFQCHQQPREARWATCLSSLSLLS